MLLKKYSADINLNFYEIRDFIEKFLQMKQGDYEYPILPRRWVRIYIHYCLWKRLSRHDYSKFIMLNKNENYICSTFNMKEIDIDFISKDNINVSINLDYFFISLTENNIYRIYIQKKYSIDIIDLYQERCEDLWEN